MKLYESLTSGIELQSEVKYCYYDYDKCERIIIPRLTEYYRSLEIGYIYVEDGALFIELRIEEA